MHFALISLSFRTSHVFTLKLCKLMCTSPAPPPSTPVCNPIPLAHMPYSNRKISMCCMLLCICYQCNRIFTRVNIATGSPCMNTASWCPRLHRQYSVCTPRAHRVRGGTIIFKKWSHHGHLNGVNADIALSVFMQGVSYFVIIICL